MAKIYQNDLAQVLVEKHGYSRRKAQAFIISFVNVIQEGLEHDQMVKIKGLGTVESADVSARESVNVNTGERLVIEGHSKLSFLPDNAMKELVNRPFSQFETVVLNDGVVFSDIEDTADEETVEITPDEEAAVATNDEQPDVPVAEVEPPPAEEEEAVFVDEEKPEPIEEKAPKPVAEEDPQPIEEETPEPVVEEAPQPIEEETPEPVVEEAPQPIEETPEPVVEEVSTPVEEETPEPVEENEPASMAASLQSEPDVVDDSHDSTATRSGKGWMKWVACVLLSLSVGFAGGYLVGKSAQQAPKVAKATKAPQAPLSPPEGGTIDSTSTKTIVAPSGAEGGASPSETEGGASASASETMPEWERYNQMHPRTRDGYYYIMGFDHTEVARQGDNARRIASRVLGGADMSCYIEVYNGIEATTELEAGTEVKIPKLEPKKTVRRRLQQQNK